MDGSLRRLESVQNAMEQAKSAAVALLGRERPFTATPWFWSDQYDVKLQMAGLTAGFDTVVTRGAALPPARDLAAAAKGISPATGRSSTARGRRVRDLRISVTDRCNFRCVYCMPKEVFDDDYAFLPRKQLLSFEEIERVARLRRPGRREDPHHRRRTAAAPPHREPDRTTGEAAGGNHPDHQRLAAGEEGAALKDAGLHRVTVSLDGIDDAVFKRMNDVDFAVGDVLDGIAAAAAVGLAPVKVNCVVKRGTNDDQILPLARHFRHSGHILRFIEYMDVGSSNGWRMDEVLPSAEVIARIRRISAGSHRRQLPRRSRRALALPPTAAARSASSPR
jgi:hypothetical protein